MRKLFVLIILILTSSLIFATDLEFGAVYETYNTTPNFGAEFHVEEHLNDTMSIVAVLDYNYKNSYDAYCAGKFGLPWFYFLAGFVFDIRSSMLTPGFVFDTRVDVAKLVSFSGKSLITFSTENVFDACVNDTTLSMIFHCLNSDIDLSYNYSHILLNDKKDMTHKGIFDILAFEKGFPFKVGVCFGASVDLKDYQDDYMDLGIFAGGKFVLDTGKHGLYTLKGDAEVYRLLGSPSIPFAITLSSKFILN